MTPEEREDLLAAYALGSLSGPEAQAVEDLVRNDRDAAADLESYHEMVDLMALTVPLRRADPRLRGRVMDAARRESRRRRSMPGWQVAVWGTAAAAVLLVAGWGARLERSLTRLEAENGALTAIVESDAKRLDRLVVAAGADFTGEGLRHQLENTIQDQQVLLAVTTDPQAHASQLLPTPAGHDASGRYVWSESAAAGIVVANNLPPLPLGSVYQAWLLRGNTAVSAATFSADENGNAEVVLRPASNIEPTTLMIAAAPAGGSAEVGRPVLLVGLIH